FTVATRNPITGTITSHNDYKDNVNNRLLDFSQSIDYLITRCEGVLNRPVKIYFTIYENLTDPVVINISDENMTTDGRWLAFNDLLARNVISDMEFLRALTPDMIG